MDVMDWMKEEEVEVVVAFGMLLLDRESTPEWPQRAQPFVFCVW